MPDLTETHPIPEGYIPLNTKVLVIGTFPPKNEYISKGKDFFFYSSEKNHFWNRIDNIFIEKTGFKKTKNKNSNESHTSNKKRKEAFARENKLGFLDIFTKITRKKDSTNDEDIIPIENIIENKKLLNTINSNNELKRICCTYKLAFDTLKYSLNLISNKFEVLEDEFTSNNEKIKAEINGKYIEIVLLYPATRSSQKGILKDTQYKNFLFDLTDNRINLKR